MIDRVFRLVPLFSTVLRFGLTLNFMIFLLGFGFLLFCSFFFFFLGKFFMRLELALLAYIFILFFISKSLFGAGMMLRNENPDSATL